jgi:hypothetical protein
MMPWIDRLRDLEEALAQADPRPVISAYHDMPYAIFQYPPEDEFAFRKELDLLATRLVNQGKRVTRISLAALLDRAMEAPVTWADLIDGERTVGLPEAIETISEILATHRPLPDLVAEVMPEDEDPARDVVFLWRTGSLFPCYRTFALLEQMKGKVKVPTILCYPGTLDGPAGLKFMGVLDADHNYRPKIY